MLHHFPIPNASLLENFSTLGAFVVVPSKEKVDKLERGAGIPRKGGWSTLSKGVRVPRVDLKEGVRR